MKKKIMTLTLSLALVFSLSACGNGATVSGPVDRDPVNSEAESSGNTADESSVEDTSSEESSSDSKEASTALTDWYNGSDRTALENQINGIFSASGMTFYVEVEEPDTVIYNYKYEEALDLGDMGGDAISDYFRSTLDSQYQAFISDIQSFQDVYNLPVTTIRIQYLDNDGSVLYSGDYTEDYVPESNGSASSSSTDTYATLDEWMAGEERNLIVTLVNEQLEPSGMTIDIYADGNVMVMDYTYTELQDLEGLTQEDINTVFDEQVAPTFSSMVTSMFDTFESDYGLVLDDIRLIFRNADGTELYSCDYSDL